MSLYSNVQKSNALQRNKNDSLSIRTINILVNTWKEKWVRYMAMPFYYRPEMGILKNRNLETDNNNFDS